MRKRVVTVSAVLSLGFCGWAAQLVHGEAMQNFVQVAFIPEGGGLAHLAGYDTDHDGREELLVPGGAIVTASSYEHTGNNQYDLVYQLLGRWPWAAGDIDGDGLADIVVQTYNSLEVFESPAPDSHPTQCVWQWPVPYPMNAVITWITDLDQDGRREMLVSHFGVWVYIFEENGDNTYVKVFEEYTCPPGCGIYEMCHGDFDLDGKMEFVTSDSYGNVIVYENTTVGVDSFAITWVDSLPVIAAYAVAAGNDMDEDGKPEFVIGGGRNFGGGRKFIYTVFESTGNDDYEPVWSDSSLIGSVFDYQYVACGDVDGDSLDEMVFGLDGYGIALYKCNGPDSYGRIWQWYTGQYIAHILIYDLNKNGYGEIVVCAENGTWIFEKELPGVNEMPDARYQMPACPERSRGEAKLFESVPNPFSRATTITYYLPDARCQMQDARYTILRIYDRAGQLVRTLVDEVREAGLQNAVWDGRDSANGAVASGVYFYRLTTGDFTATKKVVVLR